jgi:ABC-type lipoprotein release transport system permease subunit
MVALGGAMGLTAALAISRLVRALLFQVSPTDPLTFVLVPLILSLVTLIAILIPARAGMRVEPAAALRAE